MPHPEDLPRVAVIHLDVELFQEVLQLLEAHLIVLVFVSFSQARVNPAEQEVRKEPRSPSTPRPQGSHVKISANSWAQVDQAHLQTLLPAGLT